MQEDNAERNIHNNPEGWSSEPFSNSVTNSEENSGAKQVTQQANNMTGSAGISDHSKREEGDIPNAVSNSVSDHSNRESNDITDTLSSHGAGDAVPGGNSSADIAAWIVTVVFHPVFLPLYGLLLIFNIPTLLVFMPGEIRRILFLMVLVNNVILPLALLPLFRLRGMISSYRLENRAERIFPLLTASFMYFVSAIMIFRFQLPGMVKSFMFASACVVLASALSSFRWKISIHAAGVGAMVATTLVISFRMYAGIVWFVALAFLVSGLVMTARLWLGAHTPRQIYSGFITGFIVMALAMLI